MVRIGTSGWVYPHWRGAFYPQALAQRRWLEYYAERFATVELNATFYRIPAQEAARGWRERTPAGFRFAVKMSRLVTHVNRLRDCGEILEWFFRATAPLAEKASAFLFQLPPSFRPEPAELEAFCELLPRAGRYALEFRNREAYPDAVLRIMEERGLGFCIHDYPGRATPHLVTSELVYLRFHGHEGRYTGSYPEEVLAGWAQRIGGWLREGKEVLAYFNNDIGGQALADALCLRRLCGGS